MNRDSFTDDRRAELARREVERRASVQRVELDTHPRREDAPGGWAVLPSWIGCDPSISPEARVVLLVLSSHADDRAHPFPSIARIARLVGRSERTILRLLAELEGRGLIERLHRFRGGEQVSSAYALRFDRWGRHGRQGDGVSRVTYRGDTGDTPQGDTRDAPRGDTGGVQFNTSRPTPQDQDRSPPTPPLSRGGSRRNPSRSARRPGIACDGSRARRGSDYVTHAGSSSARSTYAQTLLRKLLAGRSWTTLRSWRSSPRWDGARPQGSTRERSRDRVLGMFRPIGRSGGAWPNVPIGWRLA